MTEQEEINTESIDGVHVFIRPIVELVPDDAWENHAHCFMCEEWDELQWQSWFFPVQGQEALETCPICWEKHGIFCPRYENWDAA